MRHVGLFWRSMGCYVVFLSFIGIVGSVDVGGTPWEGSWTLFPNLVWGVVPAPQVIHMHSEGDNHCIKGRNSESITLWVFQGSPG